MKAIVAGLGLSLLASAALAQGVVNPPTPGVSSADTPPAAQAMPGQAGNGGGGKHGVTPQGGPMPSRAGGMDGATADSDNYEGMIVRTPHGTFLVRPNQGENDAMDQEGGGDEATMGDQAQMPPPPPPAAMPRPHPPHPPMMQTKAARFRIKMGDMEIGVTCGEDEPIRNCVEAVGALVDKISAAQHH